MILLSNLSRVTSKWCQCFSSRFDWSFRKSSSTKIFSISPTIWSNSSWLWWMSNISSSSSDEITRGSWTPLPPEKLKIFNDIPFYSYPFNKDSFWEKNLFREDSCWSCWCWIPPFWSCSPCSSLIIFFLIFKICFFP